MHEAAWITGRVVENTALFLAQSENLTEFWNRDTTTRRMKEADAMDARFCVNRKMATSFMRLFMNRQAYAIQRAPLAERFCPLLPGTGLEDQRIETAR